MPIQTIRQVANKILSSIVVPLCFLSFACAQPAGPGSGIQGAGSGDGTAASAADEACLALTAGEVTVFLEEPGEGNSHEILGILLEPTGNPSEKYRKHVIQDGEGKRHTFTYASPSGPLSIPDGAEYKFVIDYVMGYPSPSGMLVTDESGLVFAAASDHIVGENVIKSGIPEFDINLLPSTCPNRSSHECYSSIKNASIRFSHHGVSLTLPQGKSGRLEGYAISVLIAQEVIYSDDCQDAGMFNISYVISRVAEER